MRAALLAVAHAHGGKTHPYAVARAGEGHVQQAQVFAQALLGGLRLELVGPVQVLVALALGIREHGVVARARASAGHAPGKGQANHGVFQALALVHGDDLHQVGVALQAQDLFIPGQAVFVHLGVQPAQQGVFALQVGAGLLQQFGQVQHVGQAPLAAVVAQPARGQIELVQGLAQHGEHALAAPDGVQRAQLGAALLEGLVVVGQRGQLVQAQADEAGGHASTQQAGVLRIGHGLQPPDEVVCLVAVEHRVAVGQVHRGHAPLLQLAPHGSGLGARAHQHRNVCRAQATQRGVGLRKAGLRIGQPLHDLGGAARGKAFAVLGDPRQFQVVVDVQRRHGSIGSLEPLGPPASLHGHKGQGVFTALRITQQKRALTPACLGTGEQVVDRTHQRLRGAVVDDQQVVAPLGGAARLQVAVDVGPAKAVDGLLGVANEQQRGVGLGHTGRVQQFEQAVLQGRGVLEFVDQRHRVLGRDARAQACALRCLQGLHQALQQVAKAEHAALALEQGHALLYLGGGVQAQPGSQRCGREQRLLQVLQRGRGFGQIERRRAGKARVHQALGRKAAPGRLRPLQRLPQVAVQPLLQRVKPGGTATDLDLAPVPVGLVLLQVHLQPVAQGLHMLRPTRTQGLFLLCMRLQALHQRGGLRQRGQVGVQQLVQVGMQPIDMGPDAGHGFELRRGQPIALLAPVVLHGLGLQAVLVGAEFFFVELAAVHGVLAQHALAPGINGEHGRFVHGFGGEREAPGGMLALRAGGIVLQQRGEKGVVRRHGGQATKALCGLGQPCTDTARKLARGGAGEGHHQDLRGHQRLPTAMAQHQAQHQGSNGPGLARARAGLDEAAAVQRKGQRLQRLRQRIVRAHSDASVLLAAGVAVAVAVAAPWSCTRTASRVHCSSGAHRAWAASARLPSAARAS